MLLDADDIAELCAEHTPLIAPYVPGKVRSISNALGKEHGALSYGQGSFGYDITTIDDFLLLDADDFELINPKQANQARYSRMPIHQHADGSRFVVIPPNSYALTASVEHFHMPNDVIGIALGKSTYARVGVTATITPLEPGWRGQLTIELANLSRRSVMVFVGEGIAQIVFLRGRRPSRSYSSARYQDQRGIVLAQI